MSKFEPWAYEVAIELLSDNPKRPIDVSLYEDVGEKINRKATQVQALIKSYCRRNDCIFPPLKYVRDGLVGGVVFEDVCAAWRLLDTNIQLAAIGWIEGDDGILRKTSIEKI